MEDWAPIRRLVADGVPQRQVARDLGVGRSTVARAVASDGGQAPVGEAIDRFAAHFGDASPRVGIGRDAVAKIWADHNLKPWPVETFKVSNDPRFEEKLVDVVGLYLKPGRAGTMTRDYKRNGTIDLFAALNIVTGEVLTGLNKGHTSAGILKFFKQIDATVPRGLAVHVVLDNLSAHSTPQINKWLAHRDRRR